MCGRYVSPAEAEITRYWQLSDAVRRNPMHGYTQHFNIAPTVQVPIIYAGDHGLEIHLARWGLVPFWWKQSKMPPFTFNARIEEAASKPMWRQVVSRWTRSCAKPWTES